MNTAVSLVPCQCGCAEAPLWMNTAQTLFWVDTDNPVCYSYNPASETDQQHDVAGQFQALAPRTKGGYIAPLLDRVVLTDEHLAITEDLGNPVQDKPSLLIGDGTTGPDGCYYFTTYNWEDLYSTTGGIFRVGKDLKIELVLDNLALPNGIVFNLDGSKLYVTEMFKNRILVYDFDAPSGTFSDRQVFREVPEEEGLPDGLIMDREGFLWSAHWQGFRITRYDPDGNAEGVLPVPVPTPTCMAFGGPDMKTLYITTAKKGLSDEQLAEYPESGSLFIAETEIEGREELSFSG